MATWKQIQNLRKCRNRHRHKWVDNGKKDGIELYVYTCRKCGAGKIKESSYHATYVSVDGKSTSLAPECIPN